MNTPVELIISSMFSATPPPHPPPQPQEGWNESEPNQEGDSEVESIHGGEDGSNIF